MTLKPEPRGLRNCNPGNIRISSDVFVGEIRPSRDRQFKQFRNMAYGYRAMLRILTNYHTKYNLRTISKMIARWAPQNENNTSAYISLVEKYSGIPRDTELDISDKETMCGVVAAMSRVENGRKADMADVRKGFELLNGE